MIHKFDIGDEIYYCGDVNDRGIVTGFDGDKKNCVEWHNEDVRSIHHDTMLTLYSRACWADFEERIKERLF